MLNIKYLRENENEVKKRLASRAINKKQVDKVLKLDKERRALLIKIEKIRMLQNKASKDIKKAKSEKEKERIIAKIKKNSGGIKKLKDDLQKAEDALKKAMAFLPNIPLDDVPVGKDENDNKTIKEVKGGIEPFNFKPKDYLTLAEDLDLIDVKRAAKVSGTRFGYLKNEAVLLEFALVQFTLETLSKENFVPVVPPVMLKENAMWAMGYLDKGRDEIYHLEKDNLFLAGTAEQPIGAMHLGEILAPRDLPLRYIGFSTCFRREAGSYGKDTKGILRVHQFDKLEMFVFTDAKNSKREFENITSLQEKLVQSLKIPYRLIAICTGDLGHSSAKSVDLEMWMPGQNEYRETHTVSNCTDFQARRLKIRFRDKDGRVKLVHTLNGTAFAIGRTLIAIIENYQQEDGSVKIPEVLRKYTNGVKSIKKIK